LRLELGQRLLALREREDADQGRKDRKVEGVGCRVADADISDITEIGLVEFLTIFANSARSAITRLMKPCRLMRGDSDDYTYRD
jgi:hypothetical protein